MAEAFIGLDLGTTGIKAVAFDGDDRELAVAVVPTPTHRLSSGGAEYDANELWSAASQVLRAVTDRLQESGHRAAAVATASMGESGVLIDGRGEPVAPIIAWFDTRTEPQAVWWRDHVGVERTHRIAAIPPRATFGATKMLWMKENRPEAWAAGRRWLNMADWAAYRLTGVMATDHSLASRTMLFDLAARRWSHELLDAAGLDGSLLAPLVPSGAAVGQVTEEAAVETGLAPGIVVGAGGQDHVCAALALGVTEPGTMLDSIGTAEAFFLVTEAVDRTGRVAGAGIGQGAHVEPDRTYAMAGLSQGGGRIDDRRRSLGLDWEAFLLTPEAEAVIDDVASEGQELIATLMAVTGTATIRHLATGGGSRNDRLIERKIELGGHAIELAAITEATALGAARLGRRALGWVDR
ncbi:MAG: FGGY-family carbohydrate kinase [Acidimicrobiales bacterium]